MELIRISTEQEIPIDVLPLTAGGHAAPIDGAPTYRVDDPNIVLITTPGDTETGCILVSGRVGSTVVRGSVDADLGSGVRTLSFELPIEVVTPEAIAVNVLAGDARLKTQS